MKKLKSFLIMLDDWLDPTTVSKYVWIMLLWIALLVDDIVINHNKISAAICVIIMLLTTVEFASNMRHKCKKSKE